MRFFEHKGARIAVREMGSGPPIIFAHCSSASHKEWLFAADHFKATHTCIMPDMIGYGKSSGHLDEQGSPVECRDDDIFAFLLDDLDEPAHIVGHSYGAAACLEASRNRLESVRSFFMIEPVAFHLLQGDEYAGAREEAYRLADRVASAAEAGDIKRSARIYMSYWIGYLRWALSPRRFRDSVVRTVPKVAQEFRSIVGQECDVADLARIDCPVTLLTGARSTQAAHAVIDVLNQHIPHSNVIEIRKGGHMLPFTHPNEVFKHLSEHIRTFDRNRSLN